MHGGVRAVVCSFVSLVGPLAAALALVLCVAGDADAQLYESVGIRAQGMGGAFVAVADDASATWWNPAGLAGGAFLGAVLELGDRQEPQSQQDTTGHPQGAWRSRTGSFAVAFPALGLSYYRLHISEMQPAGPTGSVAVDRLDVGPGDVRLRTLVVSQFGVTAGQSIGDTLVVATTLKLLDGSLGTGVRTGADATLDRADDLGGASEIRGDMDLGAMWSLGSARIGVGIRNLVAPTFRNGADEIQVPRQVRIGAAASTNRTGLGPGLTVDVDADLTTTPTAVGDARHVAVGAEAWNSSRRYMLRGGLSANTVGDARPAASAGASFAVKPGMYVDAAGTAGSDRAMRGWGIGLRVTF